MDKTISRRKFMQGAAIAGLAVTLCPGLVLAQARTDQRLVIVIQRGAMDGLAAVAPYGDPDYASLRGDLALSSDTLLRMDDRFGLHPSLKPLHDMFAADELAVVHAAASPYRERSHFEGQSVLELGSTGQPYALQTGWLNRVAAAINARDNTLGLAFGENIPMMLRGDVKIGSYAPSALPGLGTDFMTLLDMSYHHDPLFKNALDQGLYLQQKTSDAMTQADPADMANQKKSTQDFPGMCGIAGQWLARPDGPRLATIELGGWDTHVQQGTEAGRLANNFDILARGLAQLKQSLGPAWAKTTVVTLTEFGRTARPNGNRGTDHGTASAIFIAGGRVKSGLYGDWPGLADNRLYQNRDLMPSTDLRSPMKGILNSLYGLSPATLDNDVYPGSGNATQMSGLIKT
jgi:uncharacterized protein (DUF1501 family)